MTGERPADGSSSSRTDGRQGARPLRPPVEQRREQVADELEALLEGLRALVHAHLEVLLDGQRGEHVVRLGDEPDALGDQVVGPLVGDVLTVEPDRPGLDLDQAEQGLEQRRLAGAVGADDADELVLLAVEVGSVEDVHPRQVAGDQVVRAQHGALGGPQVLLAPGDLFLGPLAHWLSSCL
jgi:hypothetical protein